MQGSANVLSSIIHRFILTWNSRQSWAQCLKRVPSSYVQQLHHRSKCQKRQRVFQLESLMRFVVSASLYDGDRYSLFLSICVVYGCNVKEVFCRKTTLCLFCSHFYKSLGLHYIRSIEAFAMRCYINIIVISVYWVDFVCIMCRWWSWFVIGMNR